MTDERNTMARSIVDKFKMDTKNSEYTVIEGDDADQLVLDIAQALAARERAVWLEAADMVDCVELLDPSGLTKKEQLRIYDIIFKIAEMCRKQAQAVKP